MGIGDDLKDVGRDVAALVHDGADVVGDAVGDVVQFQVDAAGDVVDATGTLLSATVNTAGQVVDATGTVLGVAEDYLSSPYPLLGPLGPSAYALSKSFGHHAPSASQQIAELAGGQPNADVILDLATDCEQLFAVWRPRMLAAGNSASTTWEEAARRFDRERGMSFATLRADQAHLSDAAATLTEAVSQQEHETQTLASTWQSAGGAAAQTYLKTLTTKGASTAAAVATLAQTYGTCASELETAVKDKAHALVPLYQETIDGKSPEDVDRIIAASTGGGLELELLKLVGRGLGFTFVPGLIVGPLLDQLREDVQRAAQQWLSQVFAPTYSQAASSFLSICDTTTMSINAVYDALAAAKSEFDPAVFAPLDSDVPGPEHPQNPGAPAGVAPAGGGVTAGGPTSGPVPTAPTGPTAPTAPAPAPTPSTHITAPPAPAGPPGPSASPGAAEVTPPVTRPSGLPGDAVWVSDANQLPQGWTVDPTTGEVLPPGAPGGTGDVPIHSPAGRELFDDDGVGDLGASPNPPAGSVVPAGTDTGGSAADGSGAVTGEVAGAAGHVTGIPSQVAGADAGPSVSPHDGVTASSITVSEHGVTMQISAQDAGGHGALVTVTDAGGHSAQYRIEIGPGGEPVLAPVPEVPEVPSGPQGSGADVVPAAAHAVGSPVSPIASEPGPAPVASDSAFAPTALTGLDAPSPSADGAADPAADSAPAAAAVHTAAWQQGWGDGDSGAQLAGTQGSAGGAAAGDSAGLLASSDPGGAPRNPEHPDHASVGDSPVGVGGLGASAGPGAEVVSRTSHWHVTDDEFATDSASWANLSQVLGRVGTERETGAGQ